LNLIPQIDQIDLPHSTWVPGHCNVDSLTSKGAEILQASMSCSPNDRNTHV
jgi:hypothetical protein